MAEEEKTFRLMHGHGPEQDGIHQREDRGVAADPDGERGNGRDRKAARTNEGADGVANIAPDIFEPGQRALIALPLDRLRQAAGANARRARRLVRRKAATAFIGSRELDVQPQLLVEIGVGADAGDGGPQPRQPLAQSGGDHDGSRRSACIVDAVRSHRAFSRSNWRRPLAVIV